MNSLHDNKGVAFAGVLVFFLTLIILSAAFVLRTLNELTMSRIDRQTTTAFYAAHSGAQGALRQLNTLINTYLLNTIASSNPSSVINFATQKVASGDGIAWLVSAVRNNNVPVLAQNGEQAEYPQSGTIGNATYAYNIIITEKSDPTAVSTDVWDFPYSFHINSTGTYDGKTGQVALSGDFTVRLE